MTDARSVSLRIGHSQLEAIDEHCEANGELNRSYFMARAAVAQAKKILNGEAPSYVPYNDTYLDDDEYSTISISLHDLDEDWIVAACDATNHLLSLFVVWASLATVAEASPPKKKKKKKRKR
jgi:uncharacterized protein (DUF1778 family)